MKRKYRKICSADGCLDEVVKDGLCIRLQTSSLQKSTGPDDWPLVDVEKDIGALIYRESQLRKREAAAAAAVKEKKSESNLFASKHRSTSTCHAAAAAAIPRLPV